MKNFSGAFIWLSVSEILFNVAAYVVHSVVGRSLGPADYGRYGLVVTLTTMIIVLVGNGIPTAMSKFVSGVLEQNPGQILAIKRQTIHLQCLVIGSIAVLFFFAAPLIAWALRDPSLTPLFQLSAPIIPAFAAASFYHHYLVGLHRFKLQAIVKIIRSVTRVGFITCAVLYFGLEGAIAGYILAPLFTFAIALLIDEFYLKRHLGLGVAASGEAETQFSARTLLKYAGPLTLFLIFYELILTLDLYFVKALLQDDHLTGLYNAAITVGRIPYYLFAALAMIMLPAISKSTTERDDAATTQLMTRALRLLTLLLFPMVTLLSVYAGPLLHLFYGDRYIGAEAATTVFSIGVGFLTVFYVLAFALNGAGQVKTPMKLSFFGFLGMVGLNFLLIPSFGIVGAALATTITCFVLTLCILWYTYQHFHVTYSTKTIGSSLLATAIIILAARFLPSGDWSFIGSGAALFFSYFALLRLMGELKDEDLVPLFTRFRKKIA